jgi:flagellin-like hook-associated protein FlgL
MNAMAISLQGMNSAISRFDRASEKLVQSTSGATSDDPAAAIVEQIEARVQFKASLATMRAADEMTRAILDIKV